MDLADPGRVVSHLHVSGHLACAVPEVTKLQPAEKSSGGHVYPPGPGPVLWVIGVQFRPSAEHARSWLMLTWKAPRAW
ncbi:hypothetical protein P7K49_020556, partial [Saguinus oedipus]